MKLFYAFSLFILIARFEFGNFQVTFPDNTTIKTTTTTTPEPVTTTMTETTEEVITDPPDDYVEEEEPGETTVETTTTFEETTPSAVTSETTTEPVTTVAPAVQSICICATTGSCEIAGTNSATDGSGHINLRVTNNNSSNPPSSGTNSTITTPVALTVSVDNRTSCTKETELCCTPLGYRCGLRYPPVYNAPTVSNPRTSYGAYPWQGVIFNNNIFVGSGGLIDNMHFLTIAERVVNFTTNFATLKVRMGEWDILSLKEPFPYVEMSVANIYIHPNFENKSNKNNIAIIRLTQKFNLGEIPTITTGCLPSSPISGIRCWVAGWGNNGKPVQYQRHADVPLIDGNTCQDLLRKTILGPKFILDQTSFLCAGGEQGKDACNGDGGSPLVCEVNSQFYMTGLVAWGIDCAKKNVPGVYTNIQSYVPWIQATLGLNKQLKSTTKKATTLKSKASTKPKATTVKSQTTKSKTTTKPKAPTTLKAQASSTTTKPKATTTTAKKQQG